MKTKMDRKGDERNFGLKIDGKARIDRKGTMQQEADCHESLSGN